MMTGTSKARGALCRATSFGLWLGLSTLACGGHGGDAAGPGAVAPSAASSTTQAADEPWRAERPAPGPSRPFDYPAAQLETLPNGVQLYLVPRHAGTVALAIVSRSGGATKSCTCLAIDARSSRSTSSSCTAISPEEVRANGDSTDISRPFASSPKARMSASR